jgi:hypothetical protein
MLKPPYCISQLLLQDLSRHNRHTTVPKMAGDHPPPLAIRVSCWPQRDGNGHFYGPVTGHNAWYYINKQRTYGLHKMPEFCDRLRNCQLLTLFHGVSRLEKNSIPKTWRLNWSIRRGQWRVHCAKQPGNNTRCECTVPSNPVITLTASVLCQATR